MNKFLIKPIDIASLVFIRIVGGGLITIEMLGELMTSYSKAYIDTQFHFTYYGLEWLTPGPDWSIYLHFILNIILGIFVTIGFKFRISCFFLFLSSMSLFLMEKGIYINHTYLYSWIILLLGLTNANAAFSIDAKLNPLIKSGATKAFMLYLLIFMISIVYLYAGFAKLTDQDWMRAIQMKLWLQTKYNYPIIGIIYKQYWVPYLISYGGMSFDLLVVPLMLIKPTRKYTFMLAVLFHITNAITFGIGTFPWLSLAMTSLFFPSADFRRLKFLKNKIPDFNDQKNPTSNSMVVTLLMLVIVVFHIIMPLRPYLYDGPTSWTEEGHVFSWRMMLRSKTGYVSYLLKDPKSGMEWGERPSEYLSKRQYNNMIGKPDMMLQFAHFLSSKYKAEGYKSIQVYCVNGISLNGRESRPIIDPNLDLSKITKNTPTKEWILPLFM